MSTSKYESKHLETKEPGDARPTAAAIVADEEVAGKMSGKVILITGCSSGIGVETARALHSTGADLYVTARDLSKAQGVVDGILASSHSPGKVQLLELNLDSLDSVRECASSFLSKSKQLNILINNAGVMATPESSRTKDGFGMQFGVNHLAHFLLFQLLKPTLIASSTPEFNSRVVAVASANHRFSNVHLDDLDLKKTGYDAFISYGQSKTANILFANEVDRRFGPQGLHATSLHPGGIMTNLPRHMDVDVVSGMMTPAMHLDIKSPEQGAATTVWAAISKQWEGHGGRYLENCSESKPYDLSASQNAELGPLAPGYAEYIYDEQTAKQLWDVSLKMVGLE